MKENHFIGEENDGKGDFKPIIVKKNHLHSLANKGLNEIIERGTIRVSERGIEYYNII